VTPISLLREIYSRQTDVSLLARTFETDDPSLYGKALAINENLAARVERRSAVGAFASDSVDQAYRDWEATWAGVVTAVESAKYDTADERKESVTAIRSALSAMQEPLRRLRAAIRDDLRNQ
jgi:hypothetical protein